MSIVRRQFVGRRITEEIALNPLGMARAAATGYIYPDPSTVRFHRAVSGIASALPRKERGDKIADSTLPWVARPLSICGKRNADLDRLAARKEGRA